MHDSNVDQRTFVIRIWHMVALVGNVNSATCRVLAMFVAERAFGSVLLRISLINILQATERY